ncbi:4067_t:CDS:1, partial [Cetraspora pellucida]
SKYNGPEVFECDSSDVFECNGPDNPEQDGSECASFGCDGSEYDCLECDKKFIFDEYFKSDQNEAKTEDQDNT